MSGRMDKLRFIHMTRMMLDVWYVMPTGKRSLSAHLDIKNVFKCLIKYYNKYT
jgi:hypothetical protein